MEKAIIEALIRLPVRVTTSMLLLTGLKIQHKGRLIASMGRFYFALPNRLK